MPARKTPRKKSKSRRVRPKPPEGLNRVMLCAEAALDKKAEDLVVLKLGELSSFTDYFVICHGESSPQVRAIADNVMENLSKAGAKSLGVEGHTEARWILVDAGDVVVHVFNGPVRQFYDLERLWIHAEEIEVPKK